MTAKAPGASPFQVNAAPRHSAELSSAHTLDKRLVHKSYDENVFLSNIEAVRNPAGSGQGEDASADGRTDYFRGVLCVHRNHPFFFERESGHIPALYLFEAIRQMASAVAHMFYAVPIETEVVVTECSAQFRNMAMLDDAVIAEGAISNHVYRKGRLVSMYATVIIRQGALEIARMSATLVLLTGNQAVWRDPPMTECGI